MTDASKILEAFRKIDKVLGFLECEPPVRDAEVQNLIETRNQARLDQVWQALVVCVMFGNDPVFLRHLLRAKKEESCPARAHRQQT